MRSLETFSLLAITFFSSSTVSILLTFTSKGPPVKGATVMLRLLGLSLEATLGPGLLEELGEAVPGAGKRLCLLARPDSVWTPPPPPPPPLSSLVWAGPGSSPLVSLGYIASVPRSSLLATLCPCWPLAHCAPLGRSSCYSDGSKPQTESSCSGSGAALYRTVHRTLYYTVRYSTAPWLDGATHQSQSPPPPPGFCIM